jgi:hypothetical protein
VGFTLNFSKYLRSTPATENSTLLLQWNCLCHRYKRLVIYHCRCTTYSIVYPKSQESDIQKRYPLSSRTRLNQHQLEPTSTTQQCLNLLLCKACYANLPDHTPTRMPRHHGQIHTVDSRKKSTNARPDMNRLLTEVLISVLERGRGIQERTDTGILRLKLDPVNLGVVLRSSTSTQLDHLRLFRLDSLNRLEK